LTAALLLFPLILLVLAIFLFWISSRRRETLGLPGGRVVYVDTRQWAKTERPLYDPATGLTGRPDYLIEQGGTRIPVEVKSSYAPLQPHASHVYQLAAYCLLVEKTTGRRPAYGIVHYRNRTFAIDYTPALESNLLALVSDIRGKEKDPGAAPLCSHNEPARCARCGYRQVCDQRLS
jgi:CRISPR-associated exonuclease Cas4